MIFDRIWWLERKLLVLDRDAFKKGQAMKAAGATDEEFGRFTIPLHQKRMPIEDELMFLRSRKLMIEAEQLALPIPSHSDKKSWTRGLMDENISCLSLPAQVQLRKEIRQEKKERREIATAIVKDIVSPLGSLIISILSLLIAYAALKLKH